jgi:hypothetical protein
MSVKGRARFIGGRFQVKAHSFVTGDRIQFFRIRWASIYLGEKFVIEGKRIIVGSFKYSPFVQTQKSVARYRSLFLRSRLPLSGQLDPARGLCLFLAPFSLLLRSSDEKNELTKGHQCVELDSSG